MDDNMENMRQHTSASIASIQNTTYSNIGDTAYSIQRTTDNIQYAAYREDPCENEHEIQRRHRDTQTADKNARYSTQQTSYTQHTRDGIQTSYSGHETRCSHTAVQTYNMQYTAYSNQHTRCDIKHANTYKQPSMSRYHTQHPSSSHATATPCICIGMRTYQSFSLHRSILLILLWHHIVLFITLTDIVSIAGSA